MMAPNAPADETRRDGRGSGSAPSAPPTNLPGQVTSFVGRDQEMATVGRLLAQTRLLTLTGPSGCGKTRLAMEAAAAVRDDYPDGVWLVDLAPLSDPALVPQAVAAILGLHERRGQELSDVLAAYLMPRRMLLLLDNCEHLVVACAQLAETLLRACPNLDMLATSREALRIPGETSLTVPPLAVPGTDQLPVSEPEAVAALQEFPAIRLFLERAVAAQPTFELTGRNAGAVAELCRQLDGLPLAIELAAARANVLPVQQIAARLSDRFRLLTSGSRTALPRQRTLQATLDWSYELLSEPERDLFRRLSVFTGSFSLEAAEAICAGPAPETVDVLDLLARLVDKSLVGVDRQAAAQDHEARYRLLETMREYGGEKLRSSGEDQVLRRRHRDWYVELAEQADRQLHGPDQAMWSKRLDAEHDNLRAALRWSLQDPDGIAPALALTGALGWFWYLQGYWSEGRAWFEAALARAEADPRIEQRSAVLARAMTGLGGLAWLQGDSVTGRARLEKSVAIRQEIGDRQGLGYSLVVLGLAALYAGDPAAARTFLDQSVAIWREIGDRWGLAFALNSLAHAPLAQGDYGAAQALMAESVALWRQAGDRWGLAVALHNLGWAALFQDDFERAATLSEESLVLSREQGNKEGIAWALHNLGWVAVGRGDPERAAALFRESLTIFHELGPKLRIALCLAGLAAVAVGAGEPAVGARLWGAAEGLWEAIGAALSPTERAFYERAVVAARGRRDEKTFTASRSTGRLMPLEAAIVEALHFPVAPEAPAGDATPALADDPELRILGFGRARVERAGHLLTSADWTYAKGRELLFYLLSHPPRTREQIGLALWPDTSPSKLRGSLSVTLYHLRRALGRPEWISYENEHYTFNRRLPYWFDVEVFESQVKDARRLAAEAHADAIQLLEAAVELYTGDLLDDLQGSEWTISRREQLRRSYLEALLALGGLHFDARRYQEAASAFRRAIAHDSYLETAHRELMRCYARLGERGQAMRHYLAFVEQMQAEFGADPDPETTDLYERLIDDAEI